MKYKLGGQRPMDLRDVRAKKRPSIVGVLFVAPALLLLAGLLGHFAWQVMRGRTELVAPVALGIGSLLAVWGLMAALPTVNPDK